MAQRVINFNTKQESGVAKVNNNNNKKNTILKFTKFYIKIFISFVPFEKLG